MACDPPAQLSPTSWSTWDQCRWRWRLRYIDGLADPAGPYAEIGTFAHAVLEALYDAPAAERTLTHARQLAGALWATTADVRTVERGVISAREFKARAMFAIAGDFELEDPQAVPVHSTEHRHQWTEGDVPMVCVIDRTDRNGAASLNPGLAPHDYKTGKVPERAEATAKAHRQIAVNGLAVRDLEGPLGVARQGALLYVSAGHVEPVQIDREVLDATARSAAKVWGDILDACRTEDFPPSPGPLCPWCPYMAECPEGQTEVRRALTYWRVPPPPDAAGVAALAALEAS